MGTGHNAHSELSNRRNLYVGRVGALALALGVGGVIAALPAVATADTGSGNSGKATSSAASPGKASPKARGAAAGSAKPGKRAQGASAVASAAAATPQSLTAAHRLPSHWLGGSGGPLAPIAAPLELAALALRRELSNVTTAVVPAPSVTTGEPANSAAALPASAGDLATWNSQIAPALTTFIKKGINFDGLTIENKAVVNALLPTVVELLGDAYSQSGVNTALTALANNPTFLGVVVNQVQTGLVANGLTPGAAHVAGQAAGYLVQTFLTNTAAQNAIGTVVHALTVVPDGLTVAAFVAQLNSPTYTLQQLVGQIVLTSTPDVVATLPVLLADQGLRTAVFGAIKGAAHVLVGLSGWQEDPSSAFVRFIGDQVELAVTEGTNSTPVTAVVALAGRAAVEHILSSAVIIDGGLGTVETAVSTFLDYSGVNAALVTAANSVAQAIVDGADDPQAAYDAAMQTLRANASVRLAIGQALKSGVKSLTGNAAALNDVSATVKTFITDVATDPVIKAAVLQRFGDKYGAEIVGVLNNTAAIDKLANAIATVVPKFLGARGVSDALAEAVNQIALAPFDGEGTNDIVQTALAALQENPAIKAALKSTVSAAVRGFLGVQSLEQAAARIAGYAVQDFFDSSPINNPTLERLASNALKSVVHSLLGDGSVRNLIGSLAGDLASGRPAEDVVRALVNNVLGSPGFQFAVGQAIGQAVGSVFGGGPIGGLVAQLVGIPTGLFIAVNAVPVLLFIKSGLADALIAQLAGFVLAQAPTEA
ncbi:hypothetical protein [Mycobacterium sp. RTGN5]|uniref:hypothetical protein n=1 Tax=Mycobacterium sp. RTGN5 TaxID=3016522 RepID=UPI0029C721B9|nr:hypothetical protein [Mycobacterium sp. RTGN5]